MIPEIIYQLAPTVKEIIKPLTEELGITYFSYVRTYKDNQKLLLTTNPNWHDYLYGKVSHLQDSLDWNSNFTKRIIWDYKKNDAKPNAINICAEKVFNRFHSMSMVTTYPNYIEALGFSTTEENHKINYYYENEADLFHRFKFYFLEKASKIIKVAEQHKILVPSTQNKSSSTDDIQDKKNKLFDSLSIKKIYICDINGNNIMITNKEMECMVWLMRGKTSAEIALIMGIELTTVNTHIKHVKEKVGLFKVSQLIKFFCENHIDSLLN